MAWPFDQPVFTIPSTPDANGYVFVEDWANGFRMPLWSCNADSGGDPVGSPDPAAYPVPEVHEDDGVFGERFVRLSPGAANHGRLYSGLFFDNEQPIRFRYKLRLNWDEAGGHHIAWCGHGIVYGGETTYCAGLTADDPTRLLDYSAEDGSYYAPDLAHAIFGMYADIWGEPSAGFTPRYARNTVVSVESEYRPDLRLTRTRLNGGLWVTISQDVAKLAVNPPDRLSAASFVPPCLYWVWSSASTYTSDCYIDIGKVEVSGIPGIGGSQYVYSRSMWQLTNAHTFNQSETINDRGGIRSPAVRSLAINNGDPGAWSAVSRRIGVEAGYRLKRLRFRATPIANAANMISIQVRDGNTGGLLPDSMVPGNSTGIVSTAPAHGETAPADYSEWGSTRWSTAHCQAIDLLIPPDLPVYLDVQCSGGLYLGANANLNNVWLSSEAVSGTEEYPPYVPETTTTTTAAPTTTTAAPTTTTTSAPTTTTAAPTTTTTTSAGPTTTAAPGSACVYIDGVGFTPTEGGALVVVTSAGDVELALEEPGEASAVLVSTSRGVYAVGGQA